MRAYLIDASDKSIAATDLADGVAGIRRLIGFDSVDSDEIDATGDRLYFDESCFIRQQPGAGRFQLDNLAPVAGRGVVVGNAGSEMRDAATTLEALLKRVKFAG
jgi:hypothetical protein